MNHDPMAAGEDRPPLAPGPDGEPRLPLAPEPAPESVAESVAEPAPELQREHRLPLRFVGSGSEYFRIWIVNLLLTLVTLGLYYPFAKVRRLRYFHFATEVGGHPLSFHADPWRYCRPGWRRWASAVTLNV